MRRGRDQRPRRCRSLAARARHCVASTPSRHQERTRARSRADPGPRTGGNRFSSTASAAAQRHWPAHGRDRAGGSCLRRRTDPGPRTDGIGARVTSGTHAKPRTRRARESTAAQRAPEPQTVQGPAVSACDNDERPRDPGTVTGLQQLIRSAGSTRAVNGDTVKRQDVRNHRKHAKRSRARPMTPYGVTG